MIAICEVYLYGIRVVLMPGDEDINGVSYILRYTRKCPENSLRFIIVYNMYVILEKNERGQARNR